ncbi:MAG: DUF1801 domain-containing protein [Flavobacterium sp.]|nr:DUF1801 domain-containing protein [Flavobacterium sp.]
MNQDIQSYNDLQNPDDQMICKRLARVINSKLTDAEGKIWHAHPVWFLDGNPIVGYSKQKAGIRLMFWSGADFDEPKLHIHGQKFKDASIFYQHVSEVEQADLERWLQKSADIQWDYKNLVRRKGKLEKITKSL